MGEKLKFKCLGTIFTSSSISLVGAEGSQGPQDPVLLGLGVAGRWDLRLFPWCRCSRERGMKSPVLLALRFWEKIVQQNTL